MGATYLGRNVDALATEGRLVVIGMQGGTKGELDLGALLRKRGAVIATTLRARPVGGEGRHLRRRSSSTSGRWSPTATSGRSSHGTMPLDEAGRAHALMESGDHTGQDPAHRVSVPTGWTT